MCYGFDGDRSLTDSLAARGLGRRTLLRGAALGAIGAGAAFAAAPTAVAHGNGHGHGNSLVPRSKISVQLYTLRADLGGAAGYDATLRSLARIGYRKVEQAGYYGRTARELRRFHDSLGIRTTSSHDGISADDAALATKLENARIMGQKYLNVPYLASTNAEDWYQWAERMNVEARAARRHGLHYGYHNHAHEFTTDLGRGRTPWDILTRELDPRYVHLEIDLYWTVRAAVELGERDVERFSLDVIRRAPQRVIQFHVKDRSRTDGDMADLGTGVIDFPKIFRAHKVDEYIVENDTPDVTPLQSAEVGYDYLAS
ncbi:sugar phosphate isomerase/epimerase family protein [Streptomyces hainanensis]|uniref:Sugar phosphate isomerase/epimerase n=1 Tax=Streptomyces hainanensis TaxID=402648 RepID=A0A4R4TU72_9ACTN|nr:sugar phosphate isomerase/epimerase [Streptomyces hainanensis]TDC80346.1 sugar phosphate isomerase/epimerase [Streptomyces hainanensis]